jgi:hypothetical protein
MTTTIKSIEPKTYQGKVTGYSITLENGVMGYLDDKASSSDLKAGESVDYSISVKQNKKGGIYNLLTLNRVFPGQSQAPSQSAPTSTPPPARDVQIPVPSLKDISSAKTPAEMKFAFRIFCYREIMRCHGLGAIKRSEIKEYFLEHVSMADASIDELKEL